MEELLGFRVIDDIGECQQMAIEVEVTFKSGEKRWCYFMTPRALSVSGDYVPGTNVRFHYDQNHMIVVSAITKTSSGAL